MRRVSRWALIAGALGFGALAYIYLTLPDVRPLATANPPTTAFIELRAAEARAAGKAPRRNQRWIAYERISPHLKRAVLVAEDSAFWQHGGVDLEQLKESMEANFEQGRFARGGSTITQQLAKNLYLSPSRNPMRKLRELIIARRLEAALSKRRILELYLNVVEWGDGIYGAEAASRVYFHKPAARPERAGGCAARRRARECAGAHAGAAQRTARAAPAHHPRAHGIGDAASACRCGRPARVPAALDVPTESPAAEPPRCRRSCRLPSPGRAANRGEPDRGRPRR